MAPSSTRHERSLPRQKETPKRDKRVRNMNGAGDEIMVVGAESSSGDLTPTVLHPTQPLPVQPRTPHLQPVPLQYMPLPTIETMLTYPDLPQSTYESLIRGGERAASLFTQQRARTGSGSSTSSNGSVSTSSEAGKEEWYGSVDNADAWTQPDGSSELNSRVIYGAAGIAVSLRAMRAGDHLGGYWGKGLERIEESEEESKWIKLL